ncbi:putative ergot alkaloid biosynthetic protein a protein [Botrytis fragariae]|uniref:Putative ergot alkaloid biosynthetic protein a protein n=1 Tax=Botrytis fragariae TaxID=1964551 RepID=A0A8H6EHU5_9HELO|nr:putative ergot alkaloid biosynthetic protein a protein [Botrytis fragariae]KAF5872834.1 putative ergot alkaloid biosynthetic protein a protein [Botrytis fragariae]
MAILVTGGTGKTSIQLAHRLQSASIPFLLASRKAKLTAPDGMQAINFDYTDSSTYQAIFSHSFPSDEVIKAAYLVAPEVPDPMPVMNAFIDVAIKNGVNRFVLLSGSDTEKGGGDTGGVWQHLDDVGVEYSVLKASWFMDNFITWPYVQSIKEENKFVSAMSDGQAPFVSASDIARVAMAALTSNNPPNHDYRVLGPELLNYDEIAAKLSKVLGRTIAHFKVTGEERIQTHVSMGLPEDLACYLTSLEVMTANGGEVRRNDVVEKIGGHKPKTFDEFAEENKDLWM